MTKLALVEELYASNFRDVPTSLREVADQIEAGKYGAVGCVALVIFGDEMSVMGLGADSDAGAVHLLLCAAARFLEQPIVDHGRSA